MLKSGLYLPLLERLWQKNQAILRSIVRGVLANGTFVDDILQDAFIRIFERDKKFPNKQEAYNYLQRVVLNTAIDYYR